MFIHDKLDEINKADDKAKYSRLIEQGWGEQVFANSNLINAAQNGAKEILQDMVSRHSYSDETKMKAMDAAIEHKQVDTVIVMGNAGNGPVQALYEWSKNAEDRPLLDRLIKESNYEPTGSAKQFLTEHCAHDTSYIFEAYERKNRATQEEYKQAFKNFITNAEMTDGMDEQKAMLSASANGTAAHIDHYISIGDKANNEFWLKNLDVACNFGNNETAKRLVEHGAKVSDDNIKQAEKYLQPGTVEVLKQAKLDQVEHQSFSMNRTHKPKSSQKKSQGLSLS